MAIFGQKGKILHVMFLQISTYHALVNIRSHFNSHKVSRKRGPQNTMERYITKKTKLSLSKGEIDEYRKVAAQSLCIAGQPNSYFESVGATVPVKSQSKIYKNEIV